MSTSSPTKRRYQKAHERPDNPRTIRLQERDSQLLTAVHNYRFLTIEHIHALFWSHASRSVCYDRVKWLYHNELLIRLILPSEPGQGRARHVYALAEEGAKLVARYLDTDLEALWWEPKEYKVSASKIQHTLDLSTYWVVLCRLAQLGKLQIGKWYTDRQFNSKAFRDKVPFLQQGARHSRREPDGFHQLTFSPQQSTFSFFIENDEGSKDHGVWKSKIRAYVHFKNSGLSEKFYGTKNWRLLTITNGPRRLDNLIASTREAGGGDFCWFTTWDEIDISRPENYLEPIWKVAGLEGMYGLV